MSEGHKDHGGDKMEISCPHIMLVSSNGLCNTAKLICWHIFSFMVGIASKFSGRVGRQGQF